MSNPTCRHCVSESQATKVLTDDQGRPLFLCDMHASRQTATERLACVAQSSVSEIPVLSFSWHVPDEIPLLGRMTLA